jgi:hypothetical protein
MRPLTTRAGLGGAGSWFNGIPAMPHRGTPAGSGRDPIESTRSVCLIVNAALPAGGLAGLLADWGSRPRLALELTVAAGVVPLCDPAVAGFASPWFDSSLLSMVGIRGEILADAETYGASVLAGAGVGDVALTVHEGGVVAAARDRLATRPDLVVIALRRPASWPLRRRAAVLSHRAGVPLALHSLSGS